MKRLGLVLACLIVAAPASAQIEQCGSYRDAISQIALGTNVPAQSIRLADVGQTAYCFALFVATPAKLNASAFEQFVRRLESSRTDKEVSAGGGGTGTTAVVAQGPAAKVLSAAVEYGALTRGVDGQVITLRGNVAGLPSALVGMNVFPYCAEGTRVSEFCFQNSLLSWLRRASFSVSFDGARGTQVTGNAGTPAANSKPQPMTFTAQKNQISAASVRLELWNKRDVTSPEFQKAWKEKVATAMSDPSTELLTSAGTFAETIVTTPGYTDWQARTRDAIRAAAPDRARVIAALRLGLEQLVVLARAAHPDLDRLATNALAAYSRFFLAQDDLTASLATKNIAALEFTVDQPTGQPQTQTIRGVFDLPLTTRTKLVANVGVTLYGTLPEGSPTDMSKYRDAQAGVQLEHGLGATSIVGPAVFSLAGYYQYQHAPSLLQVDPLKPLPGIAFSGLPDGAKTVFTNTGSIWLGQAKLALTPPNSSMKIPLSLTLSNRTELVDKPTVRAQVGLTYDFDSLLGAWQQSRQAQ